MSIQSSRGSCVALAFVAACAAFPGSANSQSLASRVKSAPAERVEFNYAARSGVCGDGSTFMQTGPGSYTGTFNGNMSDIVSSRCADGPVRVVMERAGDDILSISTYAGPLTTTAGASNIGTVRAADAAAYLLSLAASLDGRAARDALLPAMLADSASTSSQLLSIARDRARPQEVRRSAMSWLARSTQEQASAPREVANALLAIANDENDAQPVRKYALSVIARLDQGAGIPSLIQLANADDRGWLAKEATSALARSGDPRARDFLRAVVRRTDLSDDVLTVAIRGLGSQYATGADAALLRDIYPKLTGSAPRDAVVSELASLGGADNVQWLLAVARDESERPATRRRAVTSAQRAGAPTASLTKLYDTTSDTQLKEALVGIFVQTGDRASIDKLISIAKTETNPTLRRRTISRLGRSDDPRIKELLKRLAGG